MRLSSQELSKEISKAENSALKFVGKTFEGEELEYHAAIDFCEKFYESLFGGVAFGEAVGFAKKPICEDHRAITIALGTYQFCGDSFYKIDGPLSGSNSGTKFYFQRNCAGDANFLYSPNCR